MKIAVVDHIGNKGGLSRVIRKLLPQLIKVDEKINITYFGKKESIKRENMYEDFKSTNIEIVELSSLKFLSDYNDKNFFKKVFIYMQRNIFSKINFLPIILTGNLKEELEYKLKNFDFIYFPWPYLIDLPKLNKPMTATFHDFNFKYYFSGISTYTKYQHDIIDRQMKIWLKNVKIIVSNEFTSKELCKFYPEISKSKVNVIPLGPYSETKEYSKQDSLRIINQLNLPNKYLFCGTNTCAHKNLNPLFAALDILKKKKILINLVLTGPGTEGINGIADEYGVQIKEKNKDVYGYGYVTNDQLNAIIENSIAVISPEMYTSDNGPATDGWARGKPVILANIPSNREHIDKQSVYAELFNYRDPKDIAEKIINVINNQNKFNELAKNSKKSINKIERFKVAEEYYKVISKKN